MASAHLLALPSGGSLNLKCLPQQPTLEMLEVCRDRIFELQQLQGTEPRTPKARRSSAAAPPSSSKALSSAQIAKEKKSVVKEIKKKITPLKFHGGYDKVSREVKFAADRLPPEAAEAMLGIPRDSWSSATVVADFSASDALRALGLAEGELKGTVWQKGCGIGGRFGRFGVVKARRLGSAELRVEHLKLSYTVKSQRLSGTILCVNSSGAKRRRKSGDANELPCLELGGSDVSSCSDSDF